MMPARLATLAARCTLLLALGLPGMARAQPAATPTATPDTATCALLWQVTAVREGLGAEPPHLQVALRFNGGNRKQTALHLPGGWAGLTELPGEAAAALPRSRDVPREPAWRTVAHGPGETVQLQWRVQASTDAGPGGHVQSTPGWLAFSGIGVLPMPEGADDPGAGPACVALQGLPAGGRWATSLGQADGPSALFVLPASPLPLAQRVQQSLYAGGALQTAPAAGVVAVLPATPPWPLDAAAVARAGARALAAQQRQWPQPVAAEAAAPWLLLVLPASAASTQVAAQGAAQPAPLAPAMASAWHQALALQLPAGWDGGEAGLERALAPALARAWLAGRFGPLAHAGRGDAALRAWFSEGWADFLAHRSLLREGLWTADDYAAALNAGIAAYLAEPARALPNATVAAHSAESPELAQLQAQRGEWLALQWHQALRRAGQPGLDAALRRQLLPAAQARRDGPISAPLATHRVLATLRSVLQDQPMRDLQLHIDQGQPFSFAPDSLGPCFTAPPAADGRAPVYRPVAGALQQADCQGWLGLGPQAEMAVAARTRPDGSPASYCKTVRKPGKGRHGSQVVTRCRPAGQALATGPGAGQAAAPAGGKAKAGGKAGAKPAAKGGGKAVGKAGARTAHKATTKSATKTPGKAATRAGAKRRR